jgi:hypothetical protein
VSSVGGERSFWEETYKALSQGLWISHSDGAGGHAMADRDLYMYLVDAKQGWIKAGAYTRADMEVARGVAGQPKWPETMPPLVAELVATAAAQQADDTEPIVLQALGLGMAAAAASWSYDSVLRNRGDTAGHWFFIVYTAKNGEMAWNTAFAGCEGPGFLAPPEMATFLRQVIGANLSPEMEVGAAMVRGGGVELAPQIAWLFGR